MTVISRAYEKSDFARISQLLIESYALSHSLDNWSIRHWEGQAFHRSDLSAFPSQPIHVWEAHEQLIAVAHPEYRGSVFFQVLPSYRHIEANMLAWAEHHLAIEQNDHRTLEIWAYAGDALRENLLAESGFDQDHFYMNCRRRTAPQAIPAAPLPDGYTLRGMRRTAEDCEQMAALLNAAFQRDIHTAAEYANFQTAPHYRPDYDLVAIAPDGTLAATAQVTLVPENAYAEFEPVCTHPAHQRLGLAKALMAEGLRMLEREQIPSAYVDAAGDNPASNALYESLGFSEVKRLFLWKKAW